MRAQHQHRNLRVQSETDSTRGQTSLSPIPLRGRHSTGGTVVSALVGCWCVADVSLPYNIAQLQRQRPRMRARTVWSHQQGVSTSVDSESDEQDDEHDDWQQDDTVFANVTDIMLTRATAFGHSMLHPLSSGKQTNAPITDPSTWTGHLLQEFAAEDTDEIIVDVGGSGATAWLRGSACQQLTKLCCIVSMISVSMNTPATRDKWTSLRLVLTIVDALVTMVFTLEALAKIFKRGVVKDKNSYFRDHWCKYDFCMLVFHWVSMVEHVTHYTGHHTKELALLNAPRPLITIRFLRSAIRFELPKNRLQQIFKRSSQQVYNVTIFFSFFMSLYAILGVQLFGRRDQHCVMRNANPERIRINDLMIPDTYCSDSGLGYRCPRQAKCAKLNINASNVGYYGMFDNLLISMFTVYMAASQEGWSTVMYNCIDGSKSTSAWAYIYFITLIFFLAWLVKNVFIAVITETFAEIRVQFSQIWAGREVNADDTIDQIFEIDEQSDRLNLVKVDQHVAAGPAPEFFKAIQRNSAFQATISVIVLINAIFNASFVYSHDEYGDMRKKRIFYFVELSFTLLFNLECVFKIWCLGLSGYVRRGQNKLQLILCIGSSLNVITFQVYNANIFTYFQVFRIVRLLKSSPMLEDFVFKIFGPGKKLGGLIVFTMIVLIIASSISLQLFCFIEHLNRFNTFPEALMTMFQILTQEGWTEIVVDAMRLTEQFKLSWLVALYFLSYHLFVTLIVLSLFVAVILDNLEMDEDLKRVKQLHAREQTTTQRLQLPMRLQVFARFKDRPQMVTMSDIPSRKFALPKVRVCFAKQFTEDTTEYAFRESCPVAHKDISCLRHRRGVGHSLQNNHTIAHRHLGQHGTHDHVIWLIEDSNRRRLLLTDSTAMLAIGGLRMNTHNKTSRVAAEFEGINNKLLMRPSVTEHASRRGKRPAESTAEMGTFIWHHGQDEYNSNTAAHRTVKPGEFDIKLLQQRQRKAELQRYRIEEEMRENHPYFDCPLFIIGRNSQLRQICELLVNARYAPNEMEHPQKLRFKAMHNLVGLMTYMDWCVVLCTLLSCVAMLHEAPWPLDGSRRIQRNQTLRIADYIFVSVMTFELLLKVIANGLFFTPSAVVRDYGGVMTVFIYLTSLMFVIWMPNHVQPNSCAQMLMICRAMRPLRIYTLVPHIRRVVVELFKGFKEILLVTVMLVLLMFIFASFAVQVVGGKLARCNDANVTDRDRCTGVFSQELFVTKMKLPGNNPEMIVPRFWTNPGLFNFDHIGNALLTLFEILSFKGWNIIRDVILEHRHLGAWTSLFIHVYVFVGCMIGLTLFVGVVIANYSENRGTALLTVDQRRWNDLKTRLRMAQPLHTPPHPRDTERVRTFIYRLVMSPRFATFFTALVVINSLTLCFPWSIEEEKATLKTLNIVHFLTGTSVVITMLFFCEIILKSIAFTFRGYWQSRRNRIDMAITVLGLFWCTLHISAVLSQDHHMKRFTYSFGFITVVLRFFTLGGRHSTLKMLMLTVVMSVFRSFFIIIAMFLLMLSYAYAGVILFGMVKYGQALQRHANFRTAANAMLILFRIVTGEDWNAVMHDCMLTHPYCIWDEHVAYWQTDCGNYYGAIVYFCSFYLIITYIVLNLLVAIIIENFSLFYSSDEDALLSHNDIRNFQQVWNIVDKEQKGAIIVRRVKFLLRLLRGRLEVDQNKDRLLFKHMCYEMERLNNGTEVTFHDVLSVDIRKSLQLEELMEREELEYLIEEEVAKQTIRTWLEDKLRQMKLAQSGNSDKQRLVFTHAHGSDETVGVSLPRSDSYSHHMRKKATGVRPTVTLTASKQTNRPQPHELQQQHLHQQIKPKTRRTSIPSVAVADAKRFLSTQFKKALIKSDISPGASIMEMSTSAITAIPENEELRVEDTLEDTHSGKDTRFGVEHKSSETLTKGEQERKQSIEMYNVLEGEFEGGHNYDDIVDWWQQQTAVKPN